MLLKFKQIVRILFFSLSIFYFKSIKRALLYDLNDFPCSKIPFKDKNKYIALENYLNVFENVDERVQVNVIYIFWQIQLIQHIFKLTIYAAYTSSFK